MQLIDANALIREECGSCDGHCNTFDGEECLKCTSHNKCQLREAIDDADTVDAEIVRHGEWLSTALVDQKGRVIVEQYKCSLCGRHEYQKEPYCHCGAKMDGGKT